MLRLRLLVFGILLVVSFLPEYTASDDVCGGTFSGDNGTITSPDYPHRFWIGARCAWSITAEPGKVIRLTFHDWEHDCGSDWVIIYDNYTSPDDSLGEECGFSIPYQFCSYGNQIFVEFHSYTETSPGFRASWAAVFRVCGGALSGDNGTITSPNYPHKSWNGARCNWSITVEPGKVVELTFHEFIKEFGGGCEIGRVLIYDNYTSPDDYLALECQSSITEPIRSKGNQMFVEFHSDLNYAELKFRASWAAVLPACGGALSGNNGTITSPDYPHDYRNDARCVWSITVEPGKVIQLTFHQFAVEEWDDICDTDFVLIYDDDTSRANPLGKKCGFSIPKPIRSNGNQMFVEFESDSTTTYTGFQASWAASPYWTDPDSQVCGGAWSGDSGTITSPDYPHNYRNDARCAWSITVEPRKVIQLTFLEFEVERGPLCGNDWVLIYDNSTSRANPLGKECGSFIPEPIWSNGNQIFVEFESNSNVTAPGYRASWAADFPVCDGALSGDSGTITSPDYPYAYRNNARCVWSITVEPGKVIQLTFHQFAVEEWHNICDTDWVLIYDNSTSRANPLRKKCGFSIPEPIWSNGNQMFVEFHSDSTTAYTGFRASWAAEDP